MSVKLSALRGQLLLATGLVDRQQLLRRFEQIEPSLHQYPAIDPVSFRQAVAEQVFSEE